MNNSEESPFPLTRIDERDLRTRLGKKPKPDADELADSGLQQDKRRARRQQRNRESAWPNENAQAPSPPASGRSVSKLTTLFMDDELLAHSIMAVNPDLMAMSPTPMSGDPNVVSPAIPIARSMHVVRLIPNVDTDPDRIRGRSKTIQAKQYCQK